MQIEGSGFERILRGYLGFLEGTGKSRLTISSYRGDLEVFRRFLTEEKIAWDELSQADLDRYQHFLERLGLKTNTRRRKLITARSLLHYAFTRKKINSSPAHFLKPPERLERLPWIPSPETYAGILKFMPVKTPYLLRNRLLVEVIAETALSVSELCSLEWQDLSQDFLQVPGKRARKLKLSPELCRRLDSWRAVHSGRFLFPGYNRHGLASERMSPRGVELLFRSLAKRLELPDLHPKTLRHFAILEWLRGGVAPEEVQRRLGVANTYPLEPYRQHLLQASRKR